MREIGIIREYPHHDREGREKRFGFIERDDDEDAFVHESSVECEPRRLHAGIPVTFHILPTPAKRSDEAHSVRMFIDESDPSLMASCLRLRKARLLIAAAAAYLATLPQELAVRVALDLLQPAAQRPQPPHPFIFSDPFSQPRASRSRAALWVGSTAQRRELVAAVPVSLLRASASLRSHMDAGRRCDLLVHLLAAAGPEDLPGLVSEMASLLAQTGIGHEDLALRVPIELYRAHPGLLAILKPETLIGRLLALIKAVGEQEDRRRFVLALAEQLQALPTGGAHPRSQAEDAWSRLPAELILDPSIWPVAPRGWRAQAIADLALQPDPRPCDDLVARAQQVVNGCRPREAWMLCAYLPAEIRRHSSLWPMIHPADQVEIHWTGLLEGRESAWEAMSWRGKVLSIYRSVQEKVRLLGVEARSGEDALAECALIAMRAGQQAGLRCTAQAEIDRLLKEHVARLAERSEEPLDLYPLLPPCAPEQVKLLHCEGRSFRSEATTGRRNEWAFCPRARACCAKRRAEEAAGFGLYGARTEALPTLPWREWSLTELLQATGTLTQTERSREPGEYATGLAGWVNRLNEIRRRLKCTVCQSTMRPQPEYARYNGAAYNRTVASCPRECLGNVSVYLSHCWACRSIIDSRSNRTRVEGFLLCLGCGSGPLSSCRFTQGDCCPRCGQGPMGGSPAGRDRLRCRSPQCTHEIKLPPEHRRTGPGGQRTEAWQRQRAD